MRDPPPDAPPATAASERTDPIDAPPATAASDPEATAKSVASALRALLRSPAELGAMLPALLDALGYFSTGVVVAADRGHGLERWFANEPAAAMLGYRLDEVYDIPLIDLIMPEQRSLIGQLSAGFRAGAPVPPSLELKGRHKHGHEIQVDLAMGHFPIPDGIAYVMVMRDVGANQPSQMSLIEADRIGLVAAVSAGFAHEINNPLTSMLLNLRSLRKHLLGHLPPLAQPQARRCIDDVTAGAERIAGNVRALQGLATRSYDKSVDLAVVVSSALRLIAPTLEPRANVIRQIFPVRSVVGEEARIGQAVLGMMLFAASGFSGEANTSNRIVVAVEERGSDVVVEVSDNGRDLTTEESLRAFDPFFRSPARGAGVGVGLGVARQVAATLGGTLSLAPRVGGGAVITMRLPAAPP